MYVFVNLEVRCYLKTMLPGKWDPLYFAKGALDVPGEAPRSPSGFRARRARGPMRQIDVGVVRGVFGIHGAVEFVAQNLFR